MSTSLSKQERLQQFDTTFLQELATEINLCNCYYEPDKERLVKVLSNKLKVEDVKTLTNLNESGNKVKDIAEKIRPKSMYDIETAVKGFFGENEYYYEIDVNGRKCDMVYFSNDEIIAIEIKSAQDKVSKAMEQIPLYMQWADRVYLVYDVGHRKRVMQMSFTKNGVGILEYDNGNVHLILDARMQKTNPQTLLTLMTYNDLTKLARKHHIKISGKKIEIAKKLSRLLLKNIIHKYFQEYLKRRGCIF